jgi:hypothetical protein
VLLINELEDGAMEDLPGPARRGRARRLLLRHDDLDVRDPEPDEEARAAERPLATSPP